MQDVVSQTEKGVVTSIVGSHMFGTIRVKLIYDLEAASSARRG